MASDVTTISFVDLLPSSIVSDPGVLAAAQALDRELAGISALLEIAPHLQRIDFLNEPVLSLLAWQMSVDVWDSDWSVDTKREAIRTALPSHRHKGTPWAMTEAFRAAGYRARPLEWPEYDGDPYLFRLEVDVLERGLDELALQQVTDIALTSKNVRSHLDRLDVYLSGDGAMPASMISQVGESIDVYPWVPDDADISGVMTASAAIAIYTIIDIQPQGGSA